MTDTICAPITAPGIGAVSVVRISGPKTQETLQKIIPKSSALLNEPRVCHLVDVSDVQRNEPLDSALAVFFSGSASYTGEDSAEISLHGSPFLLKRFLENLHALGVRSARPGEFTERAFLNGKLDLAQAEAVADLIHAETEAQARIAREQLSGKLSEAITDLGEPLRDLLAEIEAFIDFPEEGIEPLKSDEWSTILTRVLERMRTYIASYAEGRVSREGASVVMVGLPNAGKSSLLNTLVGEERAIVTPIPGTTRDSIEERITLDGLLIRLWDTAGLAGEELTEHKPDAIEQLGIERSWERARRADLVLFLFDSSLPFETQTPILKRVESISSNILFVGTKSDLPSAADLPNEIVRISSKSGSGIRELCQAITSRLVGERRGSLLISNERHLEALKLAALRLEEGLTAIRSQTPPEFIAASLRSSLNALEEIIGITTTDDILGLIFSKFCIGK